MSLQTFEEVRPWAKAIKERVSARMMPPWFIDPNVGINQFKNYGGLSDDEIATLVKWVDAGAPRGNPADMPPPAKFDDDIWHIGAPELVAAMPEDGRIDSQEISSDPFFARAALSAWRTVKSRDRAAASVWRAAIRARRAVRKASSATKILDVPFMRSGCPLYAFQGLIQAGKA